MRALLSCLLTFSVKLIRKMSLIVLGEILAVFVKTMTADGKYPVGVCKNLQHPIQMQLSEKSKSFCQFFFPFLESISNFQHFGKNMIVIANVFPKL